MYFTHYKNILHSKFPLLFMVIQFIIIGCGLGQSQAKPSWSQQLWPSSGFCQAKAPKSQAKALKARPSRAVHNPSSVTFSHDGKFVVSASHDKTIRIWSTQQIQQSLYTNQSTVDDNGWVKGENGELLFWVPPCHRLCLRKPNNTRIIGPNETQLDFGNVRWGKDWAQCYTP